MRVPTASKVSAPLQLVRARSTVASASSSMLEAKSRVREHARNISRSSPREATPSSSVRPSPAPGYQQLPTKNNVPYPPPTLGPNADGPLDHSFIGMSGGQIFHEMMVRHGVKHIFGYPGGAILPVFDAIYNSPQFDFVLPRHEQGAGHMAEGYARVTGKPGVVLVTSGPGATNVITPMQDALSDGVPLVVFSGQVATSAIGSDAFQEADVVGISRACTKWNVMGLGAFDETDEKSLHMLGMHGSAYANLAMQQADVIIALGARFDDRVTGKVDLFAPAARAAALQGRGGIIHFEIQPKNINKVVEASIPVLGDVVSNMAALAPLIRSVPRKEWFDDIREWKAKYPFTYEKSKPGAPMKPQEVIEELDRQTAHRKEDVIITTGVGQHQMWAAQHFRWRHPRSMVTSGGLGTMGFGLPSAIGAKVGAPNKTVIDIDGDASFSMTAMELQTASQYGIGVKVMVLNNEFQGMVLQWQDLFYDARYAHTRMVNPDFIALAKAMRIHAIRCEHAEDLPAKMKEFLEYDDSKPVLMECVVETNEHVFPMVPAGKALHEQILHPSFREAYAKAHGRKE
ncbi:hypothetical protein BN946_scf185014.g139 [Trametes cinnabarina]|uniref:Acetolactate synthase n=1 Tax=Pycnoporus cinnabarinus TaxID=5643 RepID=A0A060SN53_PYCCI|nr:hypothetical protein BN946_scf185014.g139 [Trametes cinnabarina]